MTTAPRFSAIIPLHNKSATIERAIRSIQYQITPVDKIIVVDDCSSDDSVVKLREMAVPNILLKKRKKPGSGGYAARNLGVASAQTEWVTFLDADDEWQSDHIASAAEIIKSNPDINVIVFGRNVHKEGEIVIEKVVTDARVYSFSELIRIFAKRNAFHINSLVIRRDVYLAIGGFRVDRNWRRGGDSEFFLRLIRDAGPIFLSSKITTLYDRDFSEVIGNRNNFETEHPVHHTASEISLTHPQDSVALKQLVNRKTVEWLREMDNSDFKKKLTLLCKIYPLQMTAREWCKLIRDMTFGRGKSRPQYQRLFSKSSKI